MIQNVSGNLLDAEVDALVNTVNTVGVMGKGIALQFKQAYPANFKAYAKACKADQVQLGSMFTFDNGHLERPKFIVNFPTKQHWRSKSRIEDVQSGLVDLVDVIRKLGIQSIAVPPLGCGNGGLRWTDVEPLIVAAFEEVPEVDVRVYAPAGAPAATEMKIGTERPEFTPGKAALVALMSRYQVHAESFDGVSHLELQKLMYFQQAAGEPLKLAYVKARYGPYADNLNFVLQRIEGHFVRGSGDRSRTVHEAAALQLLPGASDEAEQFLASETATLARIDAVLDLATGFESPYGLELLSTVHWIAATEDPSSAEDLGRIVNHVHGWNRRKGRLFTERHISIAWEHLKRKQGSWMERTAVAT